MNYQKQLNDLLEKRRKVQNQHDKPGQTAIRKELYAQGLERIDADIEQLHLLMAPTPAPRQAQKPCPIDQRRQKQRPTQPPPQPVQDNRDTPPNLVWTFEPQEPAPEAPTRADPEPAPLSAEPPPVVRPAAADRPSVVPTPNRQTTDRQPTDNERTTDRQPQTAPAAEPSTYHISTDEQQAITVVVDGVAYDENQITDKVRKWYTRWKRAEADARRLCPASKVKRLQTAQRNQVKYEAARQALSDHFHFSESTTTVSIVRRRQYVAQAEQFETKR